MCFVDPRIGEVDAFIGGLRAPELTYRSEVRG
jgi:hypothetical protein